MSHKLLDITLYYADSGDLERKFTLRQNVVSDLYVLNLNSYKPPKTSRISVTLTDEDEIKGYFGSILNVDAKFDKDNFWTHSDTDQNKILLNTVHRIALLCADKYGWNKSVFYLAFDKVLQVDFKYKIEGPKRASPSRQYKAAIQLEKNEICSIISAVFYDKSDHNIKTVELLKSYQHLMFYGGIIKRYKWFNRKEFGLYTRNEELTIRASLDLESCEISIDPKDSKLEELEGYLRRITYQEFKKPEDIVKWMNR